MIKLFDLNGDADADNKLAAARYNFSSVSYHKSSPKQATQTAPKIVTRFQQRMNQVNWTDKFHPEISKSETKLRARMKVETYFYDSKS